MKNKKIIYKIISYLIILIIFFFLGKVLVSNYQKIKEYDFSFNYFYLLASFFVLLLVLISYGLIWNKILRILEPSQRISYFKAIKIFVYSSFGKYMPGKAWMFIGRVYLGQKQGVNKKALTISTIYEIILSIVSAFLLSLFLLGAFWGARLFDFYIIPILVIIAGLCLVHPRVLYFMMNFVLKKIKKIELSLTDFLSYRSILQIISYYFIIYSLSGIGFFFLIRSIVYLPFSDTIEVIGAFVLASILGVVAVFAPSGLGVREGVLVIFLQSYFPLSISVLISLIARIWITLGEIIIFTFIYLYSKLRKL